MDRLPHEILQQIGLNLEGPAYCPPRDLSSFSQVNHVCNQVAVPILYRNLTLRFEDIQGLEAALSKVTEAPLGSYFKEYARRLSVVCIDLPADCGSEQAQTWQLEPWAISMATDRRPATREGFLEHYMTSCYSPSGGHILSSGPRRLHETRNWAPVVSLIASLDRLEQFDFVTSNDFTTSLMEAFLHHHPHCKINILEHQGVGFSPLGPEAKNGSIRGSKFNMDTLQLPGLHTLTTSLPHAYERPIGQRLLYEMLPFLFTSPGLKHLCLESNDNVYSSGLDLLKATWQSLIDTNQPKPISQLESVTVPSNKFEADLLGKLATAGNLSQLRTLDIGWILEPENLVNIAGLFPNLERFFIDLNTRNLRTLTAKTDIEGSIAGILAFRPLKYLYIKGLRSVQSLDRIIQHHGPSLKGLILVPDRLHEYPRLRLSELLEMAIRCPNLEELRLQIRRSVGNEAECEMYKALGTFSNLQRLFLDLDFDARPKLPALGSHETEDLDALRQTFINAATDENLALQIWNMIRNKNSRLKDLRLFPFGNQRFSAEERYLLNSFARSYLLTRYNLENPGLLVIEHIGKMAWEVKRAKQGAWADIIRDGELRLPNRIVSVLHKIWPLVPEQSDWWTCWTSLPLQPDKGLLDERYISMNSHP